MNEKIETLVAKGVGSALGVGALAVGAGPAMALGGDTLVKNVDTAALASPAATLVETGRAFLGDAGLVAPNALAFGAGRALIGDARLMAAAPAAVAVDAGRALINDPRLVSPVGLGFGGVGGAFLARSADYGIAKPALLAADMAWGGPAMLKTDLMGAKLMKAW